MKALKNVGFCVAVMILGALPLRAQWNQNSSVGPFNYTDPANWVGGVINNVVGTSPVATGLILQFPSDFTLTNGLLLSCLGSSNVTFQSDSATPRTLRLSLGNFLRTNNNGGTITIGTVANPLVLDINGATRTIGGGGALSTGSANICTNNINAQIIDSSGLTNGVVFGGGNVFANLLNTNNSFVGPVTFPALRGGTFASIRSIGAGASALGAPVDAASGTITTSDGGSSGQLRYTGKGDTSDRTFVWNVTAYHAGVSWTGDYVFNDVGSGLLKLSGPWLFPTNGVTNSEFVVSITGTNAALELDGYVRGSVNPANGYFTSLLFYGIVSTNHFTLTGATNDFKDFTVSNAVMVYNNTAPIGMPSALGAGTNITLSPSTTGTGWPANAGQGTSLQYSGLTNATFARNLQLVASVNSSYWALDNIGTNTVLTFSNNITWATNYYNIYTTFKIPYLFINPNANGVNVSTNVVLSYIPDGNFSVFGTPLGTTVAASCPSGLTVNNGGLVQLLNPTNTFAGGVQIAYARTMQVMTLADIGQPSSIGTALAPYAANGTYQLVGINLGSTDSQRGGIFSYIGTNNATSNQRIAILGSLTGALNSGTIRNDSPNGSSLHLTDTGNWSLYNMTNCVVNVGGSAATTNTLDSVIPDVSGSANPSDLIVNGSAWRLTANQTYSGTTYVASATLVLNGSIAAGHGLTVGTSGVLAGNGTVNENINVLTNGTITAGDGDVGVLTINGNLTNAGKIYMKLNSLAGTNDQLVLGANALSYGGTLTVTNLAGTLALSNSFVLFTAGSYSGSFAATNLPALTAGLSWDLSGLTNGTIAIVGSVPANPPAITGVTLSGSSLVISGTNGTASGTFYVLASTNLTLPMVNWNAVSTNSFDPSGNFNVTNLIVPGVPDNFYRIKLP